MIMIRHALKLILQLPWKIDTSKNSEQCPFETWSKLWLKMSNIFHKIETKWFSTILDYIKSVTFFKVHNQHLHAAENERYNMLYKPVGKLMNGPARRALN